MVAADAFRIDHDAVERSRARRWVWPVCRGISLVSPRWLMTISFGMWWSSCPLGWGRPAGRRRRPPPLAPCGQCRRGATRSKVRTERGIPHLAALALWRAGFEQSFSIGYRPAHVDRRIFFARRAPRARRGRHHAARARPWPVRPLAALALDPRRRGARRTRLRHCAAPAARTRRRAALAAPRLQGRALPRRCRGLPPQRDHAGPVLVRAVAHGGGAAPGRRAHPAARWS